MRIAHIATSDLPVTSRHGGALQRRVLALARLQAAQGHAVVVFSPAPFDRADTIDGFAVEHVQLRSRRPMKDYEFLLRARRRLREVAGGDRVLVHAHGSPDAARIIRGSRISVVQTVDYFRYRLAERGLGRRYYRSSLRRFRAIMTVSRYCAAELERFYGELRTPIHVVPNGVDLDQFAAAPASAAQAREALGLPPGDLILYLGRICEQKGSDLLAPLARRLRADGRAVSVVAAGPAEVFGNTASSRLVSTLREAGVICLGPVEERHLAGLLNAASVFVLPTRRDEMFGMAAAEAAACGVPVVASDLGGIPEAVGPGARLVPPGDVHALEGAVLELLDDPALRGVLSAHGRAHVARFDWQRIAASLEPIYAEAVDG